MMQPLDGSDIVDTLPLGAPGPQGELGPRGLPGPQGIPGIPGSLGPIGLSTYQGASTPDSSYGRDGETFLVSTTGDLFRKTGGTWVKTGNMRGLSPEYEVQGINFRFRQPDGTWGPFVELQLVNDYVERAEDAAENAENASRYFLGAFPSTAIPTVGRFGEPLVAGYSYFNTTDSEVKVRNSAGQWQTQVPGAADYYTKPQTAALIAAIPATPPILPVTLTTPAANATGVFAGGTYTFVARAFVGDTTGFYSNYGVAVLNRFVNVYEPGGTAPIYTFTATGGGPTLVASTTGTPLVVSHTYQFEFGYTDVQGNVTKSPKVTATTNSVFVPPVTIGTADGGGFRGFENFGDGYLYNLITAAKSTEAAKQSQPSSGSTGTLSRLNGPFNSSTIAANGSAFAAAFYAEGLSSGGFDDWYLGAIDELRAISARLNPSAAPVAAFQAGGSEVFASAVSWSSSEVAAFTASAINMASGAETTATKSVSSLVRAIRRVLVPLPAGLTYGQAYEGGFLIAAFTDMEVALPNTFLLILSDKATEVTRAWQTTASSTNIRSRTNGLANGNALSGSGVPAVQYCQDLVSGSKSDWYLPAIDELLTIIRMNSLMSSGQQLSASGGTNSYWSSTEVDASTAKSANWSSAAETGVAKTTAGYTVRPIRRVLLPAS